MHSILRIFKFAFQGFFRNFWLSLVTITMMLMAVLSVTLLMGMDYIREVTIKGVENKVDVLVEMKLEADREQVESLVNDLDELSEVKVVDIITPEENWQMFLENNKDSEATQVLEVFEEDENPFPYFLAIQAYELDQYPKILEFINQEKYSAFVQSSDADTHEQVINKINDLANFVNKYSWYITGLFVLISIVVIFNTIRMSIYTRQSEITIMKLVGASNWVVRTPFVIESVLYSLAAVLIVMVIIYPLLNFIQPSLNTYFDGIQAVNIAKYFKDNYLQIFGTQFLGLALINMISTSLAVRKYLKV
ncbi:FtsX-like permease family protein [Candidatus Parcubacteria bacterium]|nr:MAG: FtsX-like permease family protein [Candidatus Parcubacteria bacterium]